MRLPAPETIVRTGWDRLSSTYRPPGDRSDVFHHTETDYRARLAPILGGLPSGARVLELGCGTGEPASRALATRFDVIGVDVSEVMIRRARQNVPHARFRRADMTELAFGPASFDAIVSLYAMIHVPVAKQRPLLERIHSWLAAEGLLLVIVGHGAFEGVNTNWLGSGVTMFWSHADAATYRRWLREIGFVVVRQEFVPEGEGGHELFLARKGPATTGNGRIRKARSR